MSTSSLIDPMAPPRMSLIVQIDAPSCPDDEDYCLPPRIYDIEPYTGAASDLDEVPPPASSTGATPPPQEDGGAS